MYSIQTHGQDTIQTFHVETDSPDTRNLHPASTHSPDTLQAYHSETHSPDTRHLQPLQTQSPDAIQAYPSQSESPDTCQTSQVSSSVSECLSYRHPGKTDSPDSSWDINDPDIPARIDIHVSTKELLI